MADIVPLGVRYFAEGHEQVKQANRDVASTGREAERATKDLEAAQGARARADREAAATAETVTRATGGEATSATTAARATKELEQAQGGRSRADREATGGAISVTRATEGKTRATMEAAQATTTATRATAGMRQQSEQTTRAMMQLTDGAQDAAVAQRQLQAVTSNTTRAQSDFLASAGGTSHVLRMMSFQLNQIAQSGAANGMWMQAAIVQIPDMLGLFGSLPLVLAGGAAALAGSFLPALLSSEAATRAATKAQEDWMESLSEAESAIGRAESALMMLADGGLDTLRARYGEVTQSVRELVQELGDIESRAAAAEIGKILGNEMVSNFSEAFGDVAGPVAEALLDGGPEAIKLQRDLLAEARTELANLQALGQPTSAAASLVQQMEEELAALEGRFAEMGVLNEQLGPTPEQVLRVRELQDAYDRALAREDFEAVANILSEMRQTADAAGVAIDQGVREKMVQAEDLARQFVGRLERAQDAADGTLSTGLDGFIGDTADAALNFADQMARAFGYADGIAGMSLDGFLGGLGLPGLGAWMDRAEGMQAATDLIQAREGFEPKAYWDVNHWRAGYGSDTYTPADGMPRTVTQGTVVSAADAERDLQRRIGTYFNSIIEQIGVAQFETLTAAQQGSLASLLHNYGAGEFRSGGDLGGVLEALQMRNDNLVAQRIVELGSHNGGINRDRRREEAGAFGRADAAIAADDQETRAQAEAAREAEKAEKDRARALERSQNALNGVRAGLNEGVAAELAYKEALEAVEEAVKNKQLTEEAAAEMRKQLYEEYLGELQEIRRDQEELAQADLEPIRQGWDSLTQALVGARRAGESVGEALRNWILDATLQASLRSLVNHLAGLSGGGGILGGVGDFFTWAFGGANANGNVFDGGSVVAFARGGVVDSDTYFPMSGGRVGLMGEAGPEAIMPLTRGADGKLGVQAQGGQAPQQQTATRVEVVPSPYFDVRVTQVSAPLVQSGMRASAQQFGNIASGYNERGTT